ncbi:DUF6294 family protein [Streptomyces silvisoli]|uniref:DUF6294 family protein n=1 Tax=Streptomyces silvisoli TaxID=3034235 RepID=A0ABT5ZVS6_9ACTN|nr:DUF6294 family protein [Streptomyces silvisoli]MDF3293926.1 DUF6294 family protein [Streptomyces silvisoli]
MWKLLTPASPADQENDKVVAPVPQLGSSSRRFAVRLVATATNAQSYGGSLSMSVFRQVGRAVVTVVAVLATLLVFHTPASADTGSGNATHSGLSSDARPGVAATTYKWFSWGDLQVGDCHQTGGYLRLYSDGKLTFSARTWTDRTFSGDIWHARFQLKDSSGRSLFTTATYDSPVMWPSKPHDWTANGTFEPSVYNGIASVTQWASC